MKVFANTNWLQSTMVVVVAMIIMMTMTTMVVATMSSDNCPNCYRGTESSCSSQWWSSVNHDYGYTNLASSWCPHQNAFSSRFRLLSDVSLASLNNKESSWMAEERNLISCISYNEQQKQNNTDEICASIVAIRSGGQIAPKSLVIAFVTGEIVLLDTESQNNTVLPLADKFRDSTERCIGLEFRNVLLLVSFSESSDRYRITFNLLLNKKQVHYDLMKEPGVKVLSMKVIENTNHTIAAVLVHYHQEHRAKILFLHLRSLQIVLEQTWDILPASPGVISLESITIEQFVHYSNFSSSLPAMQSQHNRESSDIVARAMIVISDNTQVRIIEYWMQDLTIDLSDRDSTQSIQSTFYRAEHGQTVTAAHVYTDPIRRPLASNFASVEYSQLTCEEPILQSSLSVYIVVGLFNENTNTSWILEYLSADFSRFSTGTNSDPFNPTGRSNYFPCRPNEYYNSESDECETPPSHQLEVPKKINLFKTAHMDVPQQLNNMDTYHSGMLIPDTLCQNLRDFAPYNDWITKNTPAYNWAQQCHTIVQDMKCDIDVLNGNVANTLGLLDAFFYQYWKTQIIALDEAQTKLTSLSHSIAFDGLFGNFSLSISTTLESPGRITDAYFSPNGMHLFTSITRPRWHIESMARQVEICNMWRTNQADPFLAPFGESCITSPPKLIEYNDFALVASSCQDHVYCPSFIQTTRNTVPEGKFIYRSFLLVDCPKGSYCSDGIRLTCPPGLICDGKALPAPHQCPVSKYGSQHNPQTCYAPGLTSPMALPTGTWAATSTFPAIPIPPGKYLLKSEHGAGIKTCDPNYYCPLARQVDLESGENPSKLLCPANTYCQNNSIIQPTICDINNGTMVYCPAGSTNESLCPAGFFCSSMQTKIKCNMTQYCPAGSFAFSVCPKGYYCPDPSMRVYCPKGHYCPAGSAKPKRCNPFISSCPSGSSKNSLVSVGVSVILLVLLFILACHFCFACYSRWYQTRDKSTKKSYHSLNDDPTEHLPILQVNAVSYDVEQVVSEAKHTKFNLDLRFENLGLIVNSTNQTVLQGVTGEMKHGQLTCILGESGSGKSSFITTLACRAYYGRTTGDILINGKKGNLAKYNKSVGFVRQDDIMHREMTVEETLYFSARTRLNWMSHKDIQSIVDNVIDVLRLNNIRHQRIGDEEKRGISGGQRKRVNVGIELVAQPLALMLDEPTSGLDSASSKELCEALQTIAHSGVNTICVIHQPRYEIFQMFEQLLLLGNGGRTVYLGPVNEVEDYFDSIGYTFPPKLNPADYLLDITSGNVLPLKKPALELSVPVNSANLPKIWKEYEARQQLQSTSTHAEVIEYDHVPKYVKPSQSLILQFYMCLKRALIQQMRSIPQLLTDLFLVMLGALIIANSFKDRYFVGPVAKQLSDMCPSQIRFLCEVPLSDPIRPIVTMILLAIGLVGAMSGLRTFGKEQIIFKKESESGLNTFAYFIAKDISSLPSVILAPIVFSTVLCTLQQPRAPFYEYWYSLTLIYWVAFGLGYIVSLTFNSQIAQLAAVVIVIMHNTMNGISPTYPEVKKMAFPLNVSPFVNFLFYAQQILYIHELKEYSSIYDTRWVYDLFGLKNQNLLRGFLSLVGIGIAFRFITYVLLFSTKPNNWFYRLAQRMRGCFPKRRSLFQESNITK